METRSDGWIGFRVIAPADMNGLRHVDLDGRRMPALNAHLIAAAMDAHLDQRRVARALVLFENGVEYARDRLRLAF